MNATRAVLLGLVMMLMLAGCMIAPGHRGRVVVAPLPAVVVLDTDSHYVNAGYHYHYRNNGWYYASSRSGPWAPLPRGHYPKEVKYKGGGGDKYGGRNSGHQGDNRGRQGDGRGHQRR